MAARTREPIKTRSYVRVNGELVEFCTLPEEIREPIRQKLLCTYLNELFRGEAEFYYPEKQTNKQYEGGNINE